MPEYFYSTVLGGFIAGVIGLVLFFIQRVFETKDKQQNILLEIHQLLRHPFSMPPRSDPERRMEGTLHAFHESNIRNQKIKSLAFLIKDKELSKKIFLCAGHRTSETQKDIIKEIQKKLNKKLLKEIEDAESAQNT